MKPGWPIVGHTWAVHFLSQLTAVPAVAPAVVPAVAAPLGEGKHVGEDRHAHLHGGLRHAYLLLGPAHIGKSTLARHFAQAILCADPAQRPCGACRACTMMARGIHPDFRLVQPTDKDGQVDRINGLLRVDHAAEIVRDAALHPVEAHYKVFLIQDIHRAHPSFSNKLLKTLEEPPPNIILCLTALDRQQLLPTIVSRCQLLELRPTPRAEIQAALRAQHGVDAQQADLLARLANGRMGWAIDQLRTDQSDVTTTQKPTRPSADTTPDTSPRLEQLHILWGLIAAGSAARLAWAEKAAGSRNSVHLFGMLELWVNWWRDVLLHQAGCADACNNIDQMARLAAYAQAVEPAAVRAYLQTLQRVETYLHHTVNTRLALEVLALRLPHVPDHMLPETLLATQQA